MENKVLQTFLQDLDCELSEDEVAVISCLKEHLIDYMPEYKKNTQSVNSEINRVIDNYRLMAFEYMLLNTRLDNKFKNNTNVDIQAKKKEDNMDKKADLIGKIIYIQLYASPNSEEVYEYRSSVIYATEIEDGKEYVFSRYTNNGVCFRILKDKIYTIDNEYYINMPNYKYFYKPKLSKDKSE